MMSSERTPGGIHPSAYVDPPARAVFPQGERLHHGILRMGNPPCLKGLAEKCLLPSGRTNFQSMSIAPHPQ